MNEEVEQKFKYDERSKAVKYYKNDIGKNKVVLGE